MIEFFALLALISLANEYLVFNDELVLFIVAFGTQCLIIKSLAPLIINLVTESRAYIISKYSEVLVSKNIMLTTSLFFLLTNVSFLPGAVSELQQNSESLLHYPVAMK